MVPFKDTERVNNCGGVILNRGTAEKRDQGPGQVPGNGAEGVSIADLRS